MRKILLVCVLSIYFSGLVQAECFTEGEKIIADGILQKEFHAGPPGYNSIKSGKNLEFFWSLKLDEKMTCAKNAPTWGSRNKIQVIAKTINLTKFENEHISIFGSLEYSETGQHPTPLLINVTNVDTFKLRVRPSQTSGQISKISIPLKTGQIPVETACDNYFSMVDLIYMYVLSHEIDYVENATKRAATLLLTKNDISSMVNGMQTYQHDFNNASYIHSVRCDNEQYEMVVLGCAMHPEMVLPNWDKLNQYGFIIKSD